MWLIVASVCKEIYLLVLQTAGGKICENYFHQKIYEESGLLTGEAGIQWIFASSGSDWAGQ